MLLFNLNKIDFAESLELQHNVVKQKIEKKSDSDIVLILEHFPVFTLGKNGGAENLNVSESFLKKQNIRVVRTERGGNITFHGPGQIVIYPVIDISALKIGIAEYVALLEKLMIKIISDWGVKAHAETDVKKRGVWVEDKKIGSVGVAIKRGIAFHGIAVNINIDLTPFGWINPCGLKSVAITSVKKELNKAVSMDKVYKNAKKHLEDIFGIKIEKSKKTIFEILDLSKKS